MSVLFFLRLSLSYLLFATSLSFSVAFPLYFVNSLRLFCFLCNSFSFLRQSFPFFTLSVVLSLSNVTSLCLSLDVVFPLNFANSHKLGCFFCSSLCFLSQFFPFFVFLCRCSSFLRHCCVYVFRCSFPTVFRQFSPTLLPIFPTS